MKIRAVVMIEIKNPDDWTLTYGCERADIREDVKSHLLTAVQGMAPYGNGEVEADITVK